MELINLKSLNLIMEESRDIIKFIAQKRGISTKKLLSTIKPNPKHKNNEILTTKAQPKIAKTQQKVAKTQQKVAKTQQKVAKIQQKVARTQQKVIKTQQKVIKTQQKAIKPREKVAKTQQKVAKPKITKNLTPQKPLKVTKPNISKNLTPEKPLKVTKPKITKNLTPQKPLKTTKQQILSKTKKRTEIIREKLKELRHKLSKSELKEIKKQLYNIENKKELLELETTKEYHDELDKKILKLDEYYDNDDFEFRGIENAQDLFKILTVEEYLALIIELIYKPTLVKSGYNNNYIQYGSKGDKI